MSAIIHINGMPGVGKLTVAKQLAVTLPAQLIDNHLVIDLILSVCKRGSPQYFQMMTEITDVVHKFLAHDSQDTIFIFTNALAKGLREDEARLELIENLAAKLGKVFIPILITCDTDENMTRLVDPERKLKGKLMDRNNLQQIIDTYQLVHDNNHPNAYEIDTTNLTSEQAAAKLGAHIQSCINKTITI